MALKAKTCIYKSSNLYLKNEIYKSLYVCESE